MINDIFDNSELALAAYGLFNEDEAAGSTFNIAALKEAGMTQTQAEQFAARYPEIVAHIPNTDSGFSATVFKDTNGELTIAFRGTEGLGIDLSEADLSQILPFGAAYEQIVDMYNWWQKISSPAGTLVNQFEVVTVIGDPPEGGIRLSDSFYLVPEAEVMATGELASEADMSSLDVTGHSLGGHLAMAFNALFGGNVDQTITFNAPGFIDSFINQNFFEALGGHVPNETDVINIVADEANTGDDPYTFISGLHTVPGSTTNIAIENQLDPSEPNSAPAYNHSQMVLTDSLAVYNLLGQLDPTLTEAEYDHIFQSSDHQIYQTLESIVDSINKLLGISSTPLPSGNDQREALYQAIYTIQGNTTFQALVAGDVSIDSNVSASGARSDLGVFLSLVNLTPLVIHANDAAAQAALTSANSGLAAAWQADQSLSDSERTYTDQYLSDRTLMLQYSLSRNAADISSPPALDSLMFEDKESSLYFITQNTGQQQPYFDRYIFGDDASNTAGMDGGGGDDHLYGMGGTGDDTITGGKGIDTLIGGAGKDTFVFNSGDGFDIVKGGDVGGDHILLNGDVLRPLFNASPFSLFPLMLGF